MINDGYVVVTHFSSIVILSHNKLPYTQACISSIREYTVPNTYEIIVVDNNSSDGTKEWLEKQNTIRCIYNSENLGFPVGCNQGMNISCGDTVVLLNNDTVVTKNWLSLLLDSLYSSNEIGAVSPVTNNSSYYQAIPTQYQSLEEMHQFADGYNNNHAALEHRIKLVGFCMVIKKSIIDSVGLFDERFTLGNFEDDDYSFRILKAGYKLALCRNVFIHHFGSISLKENPEAYGQLLLNNREKFEDKWGFNPIYSTSIRHDVLQLMDMHAPLETLRILEIGCACGATLLEIKNRYKYSELYGIELDENCAELCATFADVRSMNIENGLDFPDSYFDYVIAADVIEHLEHPWTVVANLKRHIKQSGKLLISVPNVMHFSVLRDAIHGLWTYTDSGLLDRTHLRFFTLIELDKMLKNATYSKCEYTANVIPMNSEDEKWVNKFWEMSEFTTSDQFKVYQYLVKVSM